MKRILGLILTVFFFIGSSSLFGAIPASERAALIALYNSTNGDSWTNNSGWKTPPLAADGFAMPGTEGGWYGITLSGDSVSQIRISNNNMNGSLPPEIGDFPNLTRLSFGSGSISGGIPKEIGNLSNLTSLTLNSLQLTGSIPTEICTLSKLTVLGVGDNQLTGSIPSGIGNLSKLTGLGFSGNQLSGSIPSELGNLSALWALTLSDNSLSGSIPPELGDLTNLSILELHNNNLTGSIPAKIGNLSNLSGSLNLSNNNLSGSIPSELGQLTKLQMLILNSNSLTGIIPTELGNLTSLDTLCLESNRLTGYIPAELGYLTKLSCLTLSGNSLVGALPETLADLINLEPYPYFDIRYNALYSTDETLTTFVNGKDADWVESQTVFPDNISATTVSDSSINLTWTPITYSGDSGGYEVYYSTTSGESWSYSGITANKDISQYLVEGLNSGTKYYFTIRTKTNANSNNLNVVYSDKSPEVTATTSGVVPTFNLTIQSSPDTGVAIPVSPTDTNGQGNGITNFTRTYNAGTMVSLSAPSSNNGKIFYKWIIDGVDSANQSIQVNMDRDHTVQAVYESPTYTLNVQSSPDTGVPITVSPNDSNGSGNGNTNLSRTYIAGTTVSLTAPSSHNGKNFSKWKIDGVDSANQSVGITMDRDHNAQAVYESPAYNLTVQSSPDTGVPVTISPNDNNGNGNGDTNLTRTYNAGTTVSLTAPPTTNGKTFSKWEIDGVTNTNRSISVAMDSNFTVVAYYITPGATSYTLNVQSFPDTGATISVSPDDTNGDGNGATNFTRAYEDGTKVSLIAPSSYKSKSFSKWTVDGVDNSNKSIQVTMNQNHTVIAYYTSGSSTTRTLSVKSSPAAGVAITVSPSDNSSQGNGTTNFTRIYNGGTKVSLTAPSTYNGQDFSNWKIGGTTSTNKTVQVTMDADKTATVTYVTPTPPEISLNRTDLHFAHIQGKNGTGPQKVMILNKGGGTLNWSATAAGSWIVISPTSGSGDGILTVSANAQGLVSSRYAGLITVADSNATNSPQTITVNLTVKNANTDEPPFGQFATPQDGSTVSSSIPVTGWVVDDVGIESVKIYRQDGKSLAYVGDAVFVEGARPDVELSYPGYPMNYQAGWGYMLLTNFLPPDGNGTFTLQAIATDVNGQSTNLGSKTIIVDNANAVKPFGAIDTPLQGGSASGSSFRNQGWVLTPLPNEIPTDGSTIQVYVDSVPIGNPTYNLYRGDIASFFPGYANSDGAHAYLDFDTTGYANGIHTVFWLATDNAGNTDGIGSRYFSIENTGENRLATYIKGINITEEHIMNLPVDPMHEHAMTYDVMREGSVIIDDAGQPEYQVEECRPVEIRVADSDTLVYGYLKVGNKLRPLPIGTSLVNGSFHWIPGPGFLGEYHLIFIIQGDDSEFRRDVRIQIIPMRDNLLGNVGDPGPRKESR